MVIMRSLAIPYALYTQPNPGNKHCNYVVPWSIRHVGFLQSLPYPFLSNSTETKADFTFKYHVCLSALISPNHGVEPSLSTHCEYIQKSAIIITWRYI